MLSLNLNKSFSKQSLVFSTRCRSNQDDILVLEENNNVVWYSEGGNRRVRQFSFEVEPLDAIFCSFPSINQGLSKIDMAVAVLVSSHCTYIR